MEILRTIWITLTSENEFLTKIITAPTVLIEAWIMLTFSTLVLKIETTKKEKMLYVLIFSISSLITEFFIPAPYNVIINYLVMFILNRVFFKLKIVKLILSIIIPYSIFALIGLLILKPLLIIFKIDPNALNLLPIYRLIYQTMFYAISFLLILLFNSLNIRFIFYENINKKSRTIILLNLGFGIFTLSTQLIISFLYIKILSPVINILSFISLLGYF